MKKAIRGNSSRMTLVFAKSQFASVFTSFLSSYPCYNNNKKNQVGVKSHRENIIEVLQFFYPYPCEK